jgi:hypothetical protein
MAKPMKNHGVVAALFFGPAFIVGSVWYFIGR